MFVLTARPASIVAGRPEGPHGTPKVAVIGRTSANAVVYGVTTALNVTCARRAPTVTASLEANADLGVRVMGS